MGDQPLVDRVRADRGGDVAAVAAVVDERPRHVDLAERVVDVDAGLLGPREKERIWERHLLNSAALAPLVPAGADVADLGSGAGLPGIPLALARPDLRVTLVEPMARRVAFLRECVDDLQVDVAVVRARAEELARASVGVVVVRALAPLVRLVPTALPLLRPDGLLLAMKGRTATDELAQVEPMLARWPGVRVSLDLLGEGEDTVRVVRFAVAAGATMTKAVEQ